MDHAGYTRTVAEQSARFLDAVRRADPDRPVPTTPAWTAADLAWHLAEVQWFWAAIVADLLDDVEHLVEPPRPEGAALHAMVARSTADLAAALRTQDPSAACWSWHEDGRSVAWVARRQAHEAIIHRVDAELAAGIAVTPVPVALAADGIDELFGVMLSNPSWADFEPDGTSVRVVAEDATATWTLRFGHLRGTSPTTGRVHDDETVELVDPAAPADDEPPGTTISGTAWDLDRWLWGRGPADGLRLGGDISVAHRLRELAEVE